MAQGDLTLFNEFSGQLGMGEHDLNATDEISVALVTNAVVPTASTTTPTFDDFTEVSGTNYTARGAEVTTPTFTQVSGSTYKFDGDNVSWTQNAGGPTDIYYGVIFNEDQAADMAIGFIDMTVDGGTTPISLAAGNISINWNASGVFILA